MAVLTVGQLAGLRTRVSTKIGGATWDKTDINLALQAVEDHFESTVRAGVSGAIDGAGAFSFTGAQKKAIVGYWLNHKYGKETT